MLQHYLKIAFRNLLKYKTQTLISIIGLAVGFTCFALATMWIHYEMTYDNYHKGADRTYILYKKSVMEDSGYSTHLQYPVSTLLKEEFPEVEATCAVSRWEDIELKVKDGPEIKMPSMGADSCFMNMFDIKLLSGSMEFMYADDKLALTEDMALRMFGTIDVIGKQVILNDSEITVCAVLKGLSHSNLNFGFWGEGEYFRRWQNDWTNGGFEIAVRLHKGTDVEAFQKKLTNFKNTPQGKEYTRVFEGIKLMPLTQYYYSDVNEKKAIKFHYLILFSVAGGLVILSALINYLSLFVTRMRMRSREIELRKVCGSSIGHLFLLFSIEYLLMILLAGILGMTLVEISLPAFKEISGATGNIYVESLFYFVGVLLLSLLLLIPLLIRYSSRRRIENRYRFRKFSIIFQLTTSVLFTFCLCVIMQQIYFLSNTDLGWERKNVAVIKYMYPDADFEAITNKIKQMSCTKDVLLTPTGLLPRGLSIGFTMTDWEGKPDSVANISALGIPRVEALMNFYRLKLLKGDTLRAEDTGKILINETGARALGMHDPIGKHVYRGKENEYTIVGVIKDFHTTAPTIPVTPIVFISGFNMGVQQVLVKYQEGKWKELDSQIIAMFAKDYPHLKYQLVNVEDVYADYLKSENTLLKLLGFVAVVCILIAAFGIFSLITLSCEHRRKEIAIRKVNGATMKKVLILFAKEYMLLIIVASVVAFPIGYILMMRWLESYIERADISLWIYLSIFGGISFIVTLCIGWRVWQAAKQNPAEVIKSE